MFFIRSFLIAACVFIGMHTVAQAAGTDADTKYIGSAACKQCHEQEYERFFKYSKKAHSKRNVEKMRPKLSREELEGCYSCHTTGYGKKGGFVSYEQTPGLGDIGCETCHGPGAAHAESGEVASIIRKPSVESCDVCHNAELVRSFNFKPLRYSGAH